jgi:uncharacterized protein YkwD
MPAGQTPAESPGRRPVPVAGGLVGLMGAALIGSTSFIGLGAGSSAAGTTVPAATNLASLYRGTIPAPKPALIASKPASVHRRMLSLSPVRRRPPIKAAAMTPMPAGLAAHVDTPTRSLLPPPPTTVPAPPAPPPTTVAPHRLTGNPSSSLAPSQSFVDACFTADVKVSACDSAALADINQARASEGIGPMQLPGNFYSLNTQAQLVAVSNAERTSRGLPAMAQNANLDGLAQAGAAAGTDPTGPSGYTWGSIYALGDPTALAADFSWMYDDGPDSSNVDCPKAGSPGCWGHRDNILSPWAGEAGAGVATVDGRVALTVVFVKGY